MNHADTFQIGWSEAAHTENGGMGYKGPDSSCVPLCRDHHREYDAGRAAFEKKYGLDMKAIAREHYARFMEEQKHAPAALMDEIPCVFCGSREDLKLCRVEYVPGSAGVIRRVCAKCREYAAENNPI